MPIQRALLSTFNQEHGSSLKGGSTAATNALLYQNMPTSHGEQMAVMVIYWRAVRSRHA